MMRKSFSRYILTITFLLLLSLNKSKLPEGFVYLNDIAPDIQERVRYNTVLNFTGGKVNGYNAYKIILTKQAADALKLIQEDLIKEGYSLVVYDGYRPQKAVDNFVNWSLNSQQTMKQFFFPYVDKQKVFDLGYVAKKSGHSRGSTVDLTIIQKESISKIGFLPEKRLFTDEREFFYLNDYTVDMFSSFDLFDEASHHDTKLIPEENLKRRNYLREKMKKFGFKEYQYEWWHFTLGNEPYPDTYFDFDILEK
jgi:D-alanyl-D-alanine dipeptidase